MRYIFLTILITLSIFILWINLKLHSENYTVEEKKADILLQLNFLEAELKSNNAGQKMQQLFPEGFVFINALYGLAWCELAISDASGDKNLKEKAISEALFAYREIDSEQAKRTFQNDMIPENGIFYFGWRNYLLSKILTVDTTFTGHESCIDSLSVYCVMIRNALCETDSPYLESYYGQSWPADMFVAMASLSNYDKIFTPKYEPEIYIWLDKVRKRLDPETKMVPHSVDSKTGKSVQGSRGSSMSLILRMLHEIDTGFANEQFKLFEAGFVSTTFGLPSVREYPKGTRGKGDVDSGPVILGVGFAATINIIGTFSAFEKGYFADNQYKTINAFGFERVKSNQKSYLFGRLPIADAFIAWGRATGLSEANYPKANTWSLKFHLLSLLLVSVCWIVYFRKSLLKLWPAVPRLHGNDKK
jgi:hypothetical protein